MYGWVVRDPLALPGGLAADGRPAVAHGRKASGRPEVAHGRLARKACPHPTVRVHRVARGRQVAANSRHSLHRARPAPGAHRAPGADRGLAALRGPPTPGAPPVRAHPSARPERHGGRGPLGRCLHYARCATPARLAAPLRTITLDPCRMSIESLRTARPVRTTLPIKRCVPCASSLAAQRSAVQTAAASWAAIDTLPLAEPGCAGTARCVAALRIMWRAVERPRLAPRLIVQCAIDEPLHS
eukprot:scaffold3072_cov25-Tisochrysis_lutea.AAC.1